MKSLSVVMISLSLVVAGASYGSATVSDQTTKATVITGLTSMPLAFTENQGQWDDLAQVQLGSPQAVDSNLEYLGSCLWSDMRDIWVEGNYAYCLFANGLVIMDVSDSTSPDTLSSVYVQGYLGSLFKNGNYVFLARGETGFAVVDVSNPLDPHLIGRYYTSGWFYDVFVLGTTAFMAGSGGLFIIDVSEPSDPTLLSNPYTGFVQGVFVQDSIAYAAIGYLGLLIMNVSDPFNPDSIGHYDTPDNASDVYIVDTLAYIAAWDSGLHIIDVGNPTNPTFVGSLQTGGYASGVLVEDTLAFVDIASYRKIVNVSDPANPEIVGTFFPGGTGFDFQDNLAYLVGYFGLHIRTLADTASVFPTGKYELPRNIEGVFVHDSLAFLSGGGVPIVDVNNPTMPKPYDDIGFISNEIVVQETLAYMATQHHLDIINVSDLSTVEMIGTLDIPSDAEGLFVRDSLVFLAATTSGLQIVNCSDPTTPYLTGSYDTPGWARQIFIEGEYAYVADISSLEIINVSDPSDPQWESSYDTPGYEQDVFIGENIAFVSTNDEGLQILDLTDPVNPVPLGVYAATGWCATVIGNLAYSSAGYDGVHILNISDPSNPILAGYYNTSGSPNGLFVKDSIVYVADGASLIILKSTATCCLNRGNVEGGPDHQINIADLTYLVDYLFRGGSPPACQEEGNVDGDPLEQVNVADLTYLVDYLFRGGPPPPPCP